MTIDAQANLRTLRDVLRYAVTRFNERPIFFGHGQLDAFDEARRTKGQPTMILARTLKGKVEATFLRAKRIFDRGEFPLPSGGRVLRRGAK